MRDLRVVEVTIQLDQAEPAARYVDMEVEAVIRPSGTSAIGIGDRRLAIPGSPMAGAPGRVEKGTRRGPG